MVAVFIKEIDSYIPKEIEFAISLFFESEKIHFKPRMNVLLKPNLLMAAKPNQGITTHPTVIEAICRYLVKKKVNIFIGESSGISFSNGTKKAFESSGISDIAKKYDAKIVIFEKTKLISFRQKKIKS